MTQNIIFSHANFELLTKTILLLFYFIYLIYLQYADYMAHMIKVNIKSKNELPSQHNRYDLKISEIKTEG